MKRTLYFLFAVSSCLAAPFDPALHERFARTYPPEESMKMIQVPEGYRLELVAAEPMINEPAVIAFDGNGRMFVAEFLTYMQDIDGRDQLAPVCRVLRLEDTDGDGRMDKRAVFADKLVLPRMIQCIDERVLIRETNTFDLWLYEDANDDGVSDKRTRVYEGGGRGGNLEHQPSGLEWNLDNWMYVTYTRKRYRWTGDQVIAEDLPHGSGQWGVTQDDSGRVFYSTGGGENPAMDFQQPIVYGALRGPGEKEPGFHEVFPLVPIPDVQGGPRRFRKENNTLNNFTGCAGQHVYRGDRLPRELYGDLFIPEPVGRLIRRAKVTSEQGKIVLKNATPGTEFLRSTDANFRPLNMATAPDGTLYIVDIYRGIIQEGNWVRKGSYLRGPVEQYGLDRNIQKGRIYRLVHETTRRGPPPNMLDEAPARLVAHLAHANGWWRDTAQKLLVVRGDRSVIPALEAMAGGDASPLGRVHALWTLEGLGAFDPAVLKKALHDADPRVRNAASRIAETPLMKGEDALLADVQANLSHEDPAVAIQAALSMLRGRPDLFETAMDAAMARHPDNEMLQVILQQRGGQLAAMKQQRLKSALLAKGEEHYKTICVTCHDLSGLGAPMAGQLGVTLGPPLKGSPRLLSRNKTIPIRVLLKGMIGELNGKQYPGPMLPLETYDDEWIASVLTYARQSWGNRGEPVSPKEVAAVRAAIKDRKDMYQSSEILAMLPIPRDKMQQWGFGASHKVEVLKAAVDGDPRTRFDTGCVQQPGMFVAIDFKEVLQLDSVILDAGPSPGDYPRQWSAQVSADGKQWSKPLATGKGSGPVTEIVLPGVKTRFLRINQEGRSGSKYWSIHEMEVFGRPVSKL